MAMRAAWKLPGSLLIAGSLLACQAPAPKPAEAPPKSEQQPEQVQPADLRAQYRGLAAGGGTVYTVKPAESKVLIYVFRGGLAASKGHNHVIRAADFEGYAHLPSDDATQSRFDLRVPFEALVVDEPGLRAETGGNFAGERTREEIEGTRRNLLGPRGLDASRYPFVTMKSVAVSGDWPVLVADVAVTLHGVTREQPVMLRVRRGADALQVSGTLVLRQSDFGVTPYSVFGGVLSVQDAVAIEFELVARTPAGASL
jgi:polyisoprenoid-binding protein YceI